MQKAVHTSRNSKKKLVIIAVLCAALALGGAATFAFYSASQTVVNSTTLATNMSVQVIEEQWEATGKSVAAAGIIPGESVAKDPAVKNTSDVPAYIVMEVKMPVTENLPTFTFTPNTTAWDNETTASGADGSAYAGVKSADGTTITYRYFLKSILAPDATSATIFDQVTMNFGIENVTSSDTAKAIDVKAYGLQTTEHDSAYAAWQAYTA